MLLVSYSLKKKRPLVRNTFQKKHRYRDNNRPENNDTRKDNSKQKGLKKTGEKIGINPEAKMKSMSNLQLLKG